MYTLSLSKNYTVGGKTYSEQRSVTSKKLWSFEQSVAAAKTGTLTTRTNNTDGTLTMTAGHGITTGQRIDLFWVVGGVAGSRRNVLVGTVATNSVPISGGAGDNLPAAASAVTVGLPVVDTSISINPANLKGIVFSGESRSVFFLGDNASPSAELYAKMFPLNGQADGWVSGGGEAVPVVGANIATARMSHGDSAAAKNCRIAIYYD